MDGDDVTITNCSHEWDGNLFAKPGAAEVGTVSINGSSFRYHQEPFNGPFPWPVPIEDGTSYALTGEQWPTDDAGFTQAQMEAGYAADPKVSGTIE